MLENIIAYFVLLCPQLLFLLMSIAFAKDKPIKTWNRSSNAIEICSQIFVYKTKTFLWILLISAFLKLFRSFCNFAQFL